MKSRKDTSKEIISIVSNLYGDAESLGFYSDANGMINFPTSVTFMVNGKTEKEVYDEIVAEANKAGIDSALLDLHLMTLPFDNSILVKVD